MEDFGEIREVHRSYILARDATLDKARKLPYTGDTENGNGGQGIITFQPNNPKRLSFKKAMESKGGRDEDEKCPFTSFGHACACDHIHKRLRNSPRRTTVQRPASW